MITKTLLDESCMDLKSVTPSRTFILEDYEMHHWGRHDSVIFENCQFKIHVIIGILTRFSIHELILLVKEFANLCKSLILDSPENLDFESILDS